MIQPKAFVAQLAQGGIDFFAGVPDSLLKNLCAYITDNVPREQNIIAANEGNAVGLAAGYHLATGRTGCVYMQNSGEGNIVNPLLSLVDEDVYHIPMLLIIGWRGEPGVHDEPQHKKQGKVTLSLLETMGVPYAVLDENWEKQVQQALITIRETNGVYALIVRKGTFADYALQNQIVSKLPLMREDAIKIVVDSLRDDDVVVSTTGMISRELFEYREAKQQEHGADFLTVGSMGHASQIALGIALQKPDRRVFVFDGDGAILMHMSVGGQPTVGLSINLPKIAEAVGYKTVMKAENESELCAAIRQLDVCEKTALVEICVHKGNRKDLGRPTTTPIQNKESFMQNLKAI